MYIFIIPIWLELGFLFFLGLNVCMSGSATSCEECFLIHPSCAWCAQEVRAPASPGDTDWQLIFECLCLSTYWAAYLDSIISIIDPFKCCLDRLSTDLFILIHLTCKHFTKSISALFPCICGFAHLFNGFLTLLTSVIFFSPIQDFGRARTLTSRCDFSQNLLKRGCDAPFIENPRSGSSLLRSKPLSSKGSGVTQYDVIQIYPQKISLSLRPGMHWLIDLDFKKEFRSI